MEASAGTAYVDFKGDFSTLNKQVAAFLGPLTSKFGKLGTAGAAGLGLVTGGAVAAGVALYDVGEQFDQAYDIIRVKTGATGKRLGGLKRDFKEVVQDVPADFADAGTAVGELNQRLGLTGKPLQAVSKRVLELSRLTETDLSGNIAAVTRLFADWGVTTAQQPKTLDKLFRASQATGIEIGKLAEYMVQFGSPLRQMGFDFDTAAAMFSKFEKEGVNLQTAMPGLRMALKNFAKDGKEPAPALEATIKQIKGAATTAEANTLAFEIFGTRAGPDMAAAIREGRLEFGSLIKAMDGGKDTIMRAARETDDFSEKWQVFKNRVMVGLEPLASKVFDKLGNEMSRVGNILTDPKLSSEEKFSKIFDLIAEAGSEAFSKIASKAGEYAPKAALAFVKGFINTDIWGKLAIGGILLAKFGGMGTFSKLGTKMGRTLGLGVASGFAVVELAKLLQEELADDLSSTDREGFAMKVREMFEVPTEAVKFGKGNRVRVATELGDLIFNSQTERVIAARGKKLQQFVGKIPETLLPKFDKLREINNKFDGATQPLPGKAQKVASGINKAFLPKLDQLIKQGGEKSDAFAQRVSSSFTTLDTNVGSALQSMIGNTQNALKALGVDGALKQFTLKHPGFVYGTKATPNQARQMGGFIVPGTGDGDRPGFAAPPKSFVLNREATRALGFDAGGMVPLALEPGERIFTPGEVSRIGRDRLEALNAAIPRFQAGGLVEPQLAGPSGPLHTLGRDAIHKVFEAAQAYIREHQPKGGTGYAGPPIGPRGTSTYKGVLMATWVRQALEYAAGRGVNAQPTSGYRSHAQNVSEGRTYFSEHEKTQYPGGAVDFGGFVDPAAAAVRDAVVAATRSFKYPLLHPIGFHDDGHASGTGHQLGGLVQALIKGGGVLSPDEWAEAMILGGFPKITKVIAEGLGTIKSESSFNASEQSQGPGGHIGGWAESPAFGSVAERLDPVKSSTAAYKEWHRDGHSFWQAWGQWEAEQSGLSGGGAGAYGPEYMDTAARVIKSGPSSDAHSFKEDVPAVYHGARTGSLNLPSSTPDSLHGIVRELKERRSEISLYRRAAARAHKEDKPAIEQAIRKNITALESRIHQLEEAQKKQRLAKAKRKFSARMAKKLAKITGFEQLIEGKERAYNIKNQFAEQLVELEPLQPELPDSASDKEREDAEKSYVARFNAYIDEKERPAFAEVLAGEADWRNTILRAERVAAGAWQGGHIGGLEGGWEDHIAQVDAEIEAINRFTEKVANDVHKWHQEHPKASAKDEPDWLKDEQKKRDKLRERLPMLRFKDTTLRKVLGEGRESFYPGGATIDRPVPPLAGSGSFEDALQNVQGLHWPDQHEFLATLPPSRQAGLFGGAIWDTQASIEELGLKIGQAAGSIDTGGGGSGGSEGSDRDALLEQLAREANERSAISEAQRVVLEDWDVMRRGFTFPPYAGKAHSGAIVPGPPTQEKTMIVRGQERIRTPEQELEMAGAIRSLGSQGSGQLDELKVIVNGDIVQGSADTRDPVEVVIGDRRFPVAVRKATGIGRISAGGAR